MIVDHHNLGILFTGFKATFSRGLANASPIWPAVAMQIPSGTSKERYDWLGQADGVNEWLDDRQIASIGSHRFEIENRDWEQTIGLDRNTIEDDQHGVYAPRFQRMGEAAALHPDELVFGLLNDGLTGVGYDGVPFFSASHPCLKVPTPVGHPGNQANVHSNGAGPYWYLMDLRTSIKPLIYQVRKPLQFVSKAALTDDNVFHQRKFLFGADARYNAGYGMWQQAFASNRTLDETNLEAALLAMDQLVGDNGKPLNIMATHIVVPTSLRFDAKRILAPDFVPTGSNGATITNIHRGALEIIVSPHLANS